MSPDAKAHSKTEASYVAIPLRLSAHTSLQVLVQPLAHTCMIFLTTTTPASASPAALGSFVYSVPNRLQPAEPLCTTLYTQPGTIDFATRVAKIVAKRTGKPTYVGWSGELEAGGVQFEEHMEVYKQAVEAILEVLKPESTT